MNAKKKISTRYRLFCVSLVGAAVSYLPATALAVLPTAASVADGAATDTPLGTTRDLFTRGITIAGTVVAAALVLGAMWQIYSSYVKAREKGDWKDMGVTTSVGIGMMAGGVIIAILAVQYGTFAAPVAP